MTDDELGWGKVTPRHWSKQIDNPRHSLPDHVEILLPRKDTWMLYINGKYIAAFNTWEEAAGAAPMLYQLHKE